MSTASPVIIWFRQDLRLADNPALTHACALGAVIPVYILDDINAGDWKMGAASRVWLHHSLIALNKSLKGHLLTLKGDAAKIIPHIVQETGASGVYWNRCYEPWRTARDTKIKKALLDAGIDAQSFNGSLLYEPWQTLKADGTPYQVYTPYFNKGCLAKCGEPEKPMAAPDKIAFAKHDIKADDLNLLPRAPRWDEKMIRHWKVGEDAANARLHEFIEDGLRGYKEGRNFPEQNNVSRLSPHLHWGEISPRTAWHAATAHMLREHLEGDGETFRKELGWREFSHQILHYNPDLAEKPLQKKFAGMSWAKSRKGVEAWQRGQTGYPIVDAGMRELWETGYMHNRVRMIVASFLIKNLMIDWREGEAWFWDCLFDADLANNAASWQWVAGCGADAAPYFRIFNPVTQGEKFDPTGEYVRRWVPEIKKLPDKFLHAPWEAPDNVLEYAGITLGKTYPKPIVNHKEARDRALEAFKALKEVAS